MNSILSKAKAIKAAAQSESDKKEAEFKAYHNRLEKEADELLKPLIPALRFLDGEKAKDGYKFVFDLKTDRLYLQRGKEKFSILYYNAHVEAQYPRTNTEGYQVDENERTTYEPKLHITTFDFPFSLNTDKEKYLENIRYRNSYFLKTVKEVENFLELIPEIISYYI